MKRKKYIIIRICQIVCLIVLVVALAGLCKEIGGRIIDQKRTQQQVDKLRMMKSDYELSAGIASVLDSTNFKYDETQAEVPIVIMDEYRNMFEENKDLIGWLSIPDTNIDYPVMQTPGDETFYLTKSFEQTENKNGCLIMDTDSIVGVGYRFNQYLGGMKPSTNLIIHGHNMKSGEMFGNLDLYRELEYEKTHKTIYFDSLYEHREYEIAAVFNSKVYEPGDIVFKYYNFFEADDEEEFDYFYTNIKKLSFYDTGVEAKFGDEFITLSTCSYEEENGRLVVVAKRIS